MENETNGKAFVLAQPKTAEQIERESILRTIPELRRNCSADARLTGSIGAKWLFNTLTDLMFLNDWGGDGHGRILISAKVLSKRFHVHEESIANWRRLLEQTGWIWYQERWPYSCWGICGVCRQPELFYRNDYARVASKASANNGLGDHPVPPGGLPQNGKLGETGHNTRNGRADHPEEPGSPHGSIELTARPNRADRTVLSSEQLDNSGQTTRQNRADHPGKPVQTTPENRVTPLDQTVHTKETPLGDRSLGANKGPDAPSFEVWKKGLKKKWDPELKALKADLLKHKAVAIDPWEASDIEQRIQAIDLQLFGRLPPAKKKPAAAPKPALRTASNPQSFAKAALASARTLIADNPDLLTERMVEQLLRAGETLPSAVAKKFPKLIDQFGRNPVAG